MFIQGPGRRRRDVVALAIVTLALTAVTGCKSSRHAPGVGDVDARAGDGGDASAGADGNGDGGPAGVPDARVDNRALDGAAGPPGDGPAGTDAPAVADAAPEPGATPDGGDGGFGAGCNTVALGPPIVFACAPDAAVPTPTGGTIVPGTYHLTAATIYGSCVDGISAAQSLVITATDLQAVSDDPLLGLQHLNARYTIAGTEMTQTNTCPDAVTRIIGFSVAGTTLTLFSTNAGLITVGVLTRQ